MLLFHSLQHENSLLPLRYFFPLHEKLLHVLMFLCLQHENQIPMLRYIVLQYEKHLHVPKFQHLLRVKEHR
jgi:hypothetical protein